MKKFLLFAGLFSSCASPSTAPEETHEVLSVSTSGKINGISVAASSSPVDETDFKTVCDVNANYVCLLPFAFVREGEPEVHYNSFFQEWGERPDGIAHCIRVAHQCNLKVMVKPQLWVSHGEYTGELSFSTIDDWKKFERSYTSYIFSLLTIADSMHAEMFCLGTEMDSFVNQQPQYWSWLIDTARKVYDGKITYAENWDCYSRFPLWEKLDYIGINAYFPLSDAKTPTADELKKSWQKNVVAMRNFSTEEKKQIIFTEYGYRSIDACASKPWDAYSDANANTTAQVNAYTALYESFWNESWFAGGFSWKWFDTHTHGDVAMEKEYSPQGKPALEVVKKWYAGEAQQVSNR